MFGVSTPHGEGVAQLAFFGLFALQHRGQEAAGIAVSDGSRARLHKDAGLVANVFTPETMAPLTGYHAIGHTRYSTTGANAVRNVQPFLVETMHGPLAVAHNGNLVNAPALRDELLGRGFGLTATSDTEVMTLMLAASGGRTWEERLERTVPAWKGAFSLVVLAADRVIAVRDPWGFRPMSVGRLPHGGYAVASETCALNTLGCVDIDEVAPGEIVTLQGAEIHRRAGDDAGRHRRRGARSSSCTSAAPTACGPDATSTTCASASARSWPASIRPTPTSSSRCPTRRSRRPSASAARAASRTTTASSRTATSAARSSSRRRTCASVAWR